MTKPQKALKFDISLLRQLVAYKLRQPTLRTSNNYVRVTFGLYLCGFVVVREDRESLFTAELGAACDDTVVHRGRQVQTRTVRLTQLEIIIVTTHYA